jgi:rhodanese-related sulfurtransferase
MKKTDYLIIAILLLGSVIALILASKKTEFKEMKSSELLYEINKLERYFTTDEVAKFIIDKQPDIILIDLRDTSEYKSFTIQGAINIPYDSVFSANYEGILKNKDIRKIFFSNGSSLADQAWLVLKRAGFENIYVMKGGLNLWFETIIEPQKPQDGSSPEDFDLYANRKGISTYFVGSNVAESNISTPQPVINVQQNKQQTQTGGGCQ